MKQSTSSFSVLRANLVTQYLQLEEPPAHQVAISLVLVVALLLVGGLIWSSITPVVELAYARGEVVPARLAHRIQHSQGGRISQLYVRNGEFVSRGARLLDLSSEEIDAQIRQLKARQSALNFESDRLQALLDGKDISLSGDPAFASIAASQQTSFLRELAHLVDRRSALEHEVKQRQAELSRFEQEADALEDRVDVLQEKMDMFSRLNDKHVDAVAPVEFLETRASIAQVTAEHIRAEGGAKAAKSALANSTARLAQIDSEWKRELSARATEVETQRVEVEESISGLMHRAATLKMAAPIDGMVKLTNFTSVDTVVGAGEVIMEIIPRHDDLLVQALITTSDIGYISVGQATRVEFDGYDRNEHGMLTGEVKHISASTYTDPEGVPYYQAEVALSPDTGVAPREALTLLPGMTAQVEIIIGEKSLLAYLGRPVLRGFQRAFHER